MLLSILMNCLPLPYEMHSSPKNSCKSFGNFWFASATKLESAWLAHFIFIVWVLFLFLSFSEKQSKVSRISLMKGHFSSSCCTMSLKSVAEISLLSSSKPPVRKPKLQTDLKCSISTLTLFFCSLVSKLGLSCNLWRWFSYTLISAVI